MKLAGIFYQNQIAAMALLAGLPATGIALAAIWIYFDSVPLRLMLTLLLVGCWLGGVLWLRRRVVMPLQTAANLIEAVRFGDYSLRGRRARRGDALGEVLLEINELGRTLSQERLQVVEAGALVRAILAEIDTAVFAFGADGRLQVANRAGADLLGRSIESMVGLSMQDMGLAEFRGQGGEQRVTTAACQFPGRSGRFEIHHRSFREAGVAHDLIVVTDVSRALRDEERQAWQKIIRVLGHEINNSLAPIKSLSQTLRTLLMQQPARSDAADIDASLRVIGDRADALSRFVATYSQLARLPTPIKAAVGLRNLLAGVVSAMERPNVTLAGGPEVRVDADAGQIAQACTNLVRNACEAVAETGGAVELRLAIERGEACITILDEGRGVANPANLFVPFFTTKAGGSGIGLTLSRQIIEAHGGRLQLENRADRSGCVVRIALPGARLW